MIKSVNDSIGQWSAAVKSKQPLLNNFLSSDFTATRFGILIGVKAEIEYL